MLGYGLDRVQENMNYYAWQARVMLPYLRGRVLEHGAGTGALSRALLDSGLPEVVLSEPDPKVAALLAAKFAEERRASVFEGDLDAYLRHAGPSSLEGIVSSNVLEHIEDDLGCLRTMNTLLSPLGMLAVYVPARPELYGSLDRAVGHCRRYTRHMLRARLEAANFEVQVLCYRNLIGAFGWWVNGWILKKDLIDEWSLGFYDKVVFPVSRFVEEHVTLPYGQNLLAIARKCPTA
jgi:SAM-dependent methyltransferase